MSAFVVDRNHIRYLLAAALAMAHRDFRWWYDGNWKELTDHNASEIGQMLWDECRTSVAYRYGESQDLPGPINESFVYRHVRIGGAWRPVIVEVFKAIDCYEYQSCEHPGWAASSALP